MIMTDYYIFNFINFIENKVPFIYVKLGDGEYQAVITESGCNCDGEQYSHLLKSRLIAAVKNFSKISNCFVGKWHTQEVSEHFLSICSNSLAYVNYHTIMPDKYNMQNDGLFNFFKVIKNSNQQKIYICNPLLVKAKSLLNLDDIINVNIHGWFNTDYEVIKNTIINKINCTNPIILFSAGMGSKVLISDLYEQYPQATFIDIGSCIDFLLTKKDSRGWGLTYEEVENYYRQLLPDDWNDPKYDYIYNIAQKELGKHLN